MQVTNLSYTTSTFNSKPKEIINISNKSGEAISKYHTCQYFEAIIGIRLSAILHCFNMLILKHILKKKQKDKIREITVFRHWTSGNEGQ